MGLITMAILAIIYGIAKAGGIREAFSSGNLSDGVIKNVFGTDNPSSDAIKNWLKKGLEKGEITREQYDKAMKSLQSL